MKRLENHFTLCVSQMALETQFDRMCYFVGNFEKVRLDHIIGNLITSCSIYCLHTQNQDLVFTKNEKTRNLQFFREMLSVKRSPQLT